MASVLVRWNANIRYLWYCQWMFIVKRICVAKYTPGYLPASFSPVLSPRPQIFCKVFMSNDYENTSHIIPYRLPRLPRCFTFSSRTKNCNITLVMYHNRNKKKKRNCSQNSLTSKSHPSSVDPFVHWTCSARIERLTLWLGPDLRTDGEFHLIVDRVEFYSKSPPAEWLTWGIVSMTCQRCEM